MRPSANALLSKLTKEGQGTTMGVAFSFESLGRIAGPLTAGLLMSFTGLKSQFIVTALVLFAGTLLIGKCMQALKD